MNTRSHGIITVYKTTIPRDEKAVLKKRTLRNGIYRVVIVILLVIFVERNKKFSGSKKTPVVTYTRGGRAATDSDFGVVGVRHTSKMEVRLPIVKSDWSLVLLLLILFIQ